MHVIAQMAAAAAAVPFAAAFAAAACATGVLSRLLPQPRPPRTPRTAGPRLATIQILNYQGRDLLERNLPSVEEAVRQSGLPHEILVVDNGSTDGSVDFLRKRFPAVRVVAFDHNRFFSAGNNGGVAHASNPIVVLLNNDMRVEADFLDPLLAPFDDPDVFAVASQIFFADPGKLREETGLTRARLRRGMLELSHDPIPADAPGLIPILWGSGGSCAFDRAKYEELGGLDELYQPFYCEDLDLSLRAWQRGWKVLLAPASKVHHEHRATSRRLFGDAFVDEILRRNLYLLHWANLRDPGLLAGHLIHLPYLFARDVRHHRRSGWRSMAGAMARSPRTLRRRLRKRRAGPSDAEILRMTAELSASVPRAPKRLLRDVPLEIAMVAPYHLWPIDHGGAVRMFHAARALARRGHRISVIAFVDDDHQQEGARHLREFCADVRLVRRAKKPARRFDPVPRSVQEFDQAALRRELDGVIAARDPDVLQIEYTQMAPYWRRTERAIVCLTEHDVSFVSLYRRSAAAGSTRLRRLREHADYLQMFHFELEALRRFDTVFTLSESDAAWLRAYLDGATHVSAAGRVGVDLERFSAVARSPAPATLLFVGNLHHAPNADAILYFCHDVLPLIHARRPDVSLEVVGIGASEEVRALVADPRIRVVGFVEDLRPRYAQASLFVAPIRIAAGVRVKLLEAFAAGVPVVSTSAGAEGLPVADGRELAIASSATELAERTLALLAQPAEAEQLAARARAFVAESYSWPAIAAEIESEYRAALRRKRLSED